MTSEATALAPAKVNLALHLTGRRADGYHLLDSLVVFVDLGDRLHAAPDVALSLRVSGPFSEGVPTDDRNLVLQAAHRLRKLRGVTAGARIGLEKNLPHGAGIGGGSSDAAAALKLLAELWQVSPLTPEEALSLGADVPVCLAAPVPMRMQGIGDVLTPAPGVPRAWLVLVNPGIPVPTAPVFALHDELCPVENSGLEAMPAKVGEFEDWLLRQRNDLTKAAQSQQIAPVITDVLADLENETRIARMSGSGSTCWGWFRTSEAAQSAAAAIGSRRPHWWVQAARMSGPS